jgi:hypothetical protein
MHAVHGVFKVVQHVAVRRCRHIQQEGRRNPVIGCKPQPDRNTRIRNPLRMGHAAFCDGVIRRGFGAENFFHFFCVRGLTYRSGLDRFVGA